MTKDVEHFFKCFSGICVSSFDNALLRCGPYCSIRLFVILKFGFLNSLYILDISHLSGLKLVKIVSNSVGFFVAQVMVSFAMQKFFSFVKYHLLIVDISAHTNDVCSESLFLFSLIHYFLLYQVQYVFLC